MGKLGRPSIWEQHAPEMKRMYGEGKSRGEIARHFETSVQTVTRMLLRQDVALEGRVGAARGPLSDEAKKRISEGRKGKGTGRRKPLEHRQCDWCLTSYEYRRGKNGERFCSVDCRTKGIAAENAEQAQSEYEANPRICPCGTTVPFEHRQRQFCDAECRAKYQTKRQPNPANYVTFNCLNCGKENTRYKNYGNGHNKYCDNACARKHTKTKVHIVVDDAVVLDSSWEALFYGLCGFRKIPCERVNRETHAVVWAPDRTYAPDFLVTVDGLSIGIEVKGQEDEDDQVKWAAWRAERGALVVLDHDSLDYLLKHHARRVLYDWATQ